MITAWIGAVCVLLIVPLQILLMLGFPFGEFSMGGKYKVFPPIMRFASGISAIILLLAAIVILYLGGIIHFGHASGIYKYAAYVFGVYLCLNTIMNLFSGSKKEKYLMTPLSVISAFCFLYTAWYSPL